MVKVRVLGLRGCSHCKVLVEELEKSDITFSLLDADKNGSLADKLEDFLGVEEYPIVIIETSRISYYIYRGETYESLNEVATGKLIKKGCLDSKDMVNYIKKIVY